MKIPASDRVALVGTTGSGKSFLARRLLENSRRLLALNPKGDPDMAAAWGLSSYKRGFPRLLAGEACRVIIQPPADDNWDFYLEQAFRLRGCIIYIDELYGVGPPSGSLALKRLYTQGRGLRLGVWGATQRPTKIPLFVLSEAEWRFTFHLRLRVDRERMAEQSGLEDLPGLTGHQFVLASDRLKHPAVCLWRGGQLDIVKPL